MPQKTIYVKDENLELYDKAEELSGKKFSDLVADLIRDYVLQKSDDGDLYAICTVEYTSESVPVFSPIKFVTAPVGTTADKIKNFIEHLSMPLNIDEFIVYPLNNQGGEFEEELKLKYLEGNLDVVEFKE